MRPLRSVVPVVCVVAMFAVASAADETYTLKQPFKVGSTEKNTVSVKLDLPTTGIIDVTFDAASTVTAVHEDGGASIDSSQTNLVVKQGDTILSQQPSTPKETTVVDKVGRLISTTAEPSLQKSIFIVTRAAGIVDAGHAVAVAESWKVHYDKLDDKGLAEGDAEYKLNKVTTDGAHKVASIEWTYTDKGDDATSAKGTADVFLDSGELKSAKIEVDNFPTQTGNAKHATITILHKD